MDILKHFNTHWYNAAHLCTDTSLSMDFAILCKLILTDLIVQLLEKCIADDCVIHPCLKQGTTGCGFKTKHPGFMLEVQIQTEEDSSLLPDEMLDHGN